MDIATSIGADSLTILAVIAIAAVAGMMTALRDLRSRSHWHTPRVNEMFSPHEKQAAQLLAA